MKTVLFFNDGSMLEFFGEIELSLAELRQIFMVVFYSAMGYKIREVLV